MSGKEVIGYAWRTYTGENTRLITPHERTNTPTNISWYVCAEDSSKRVLLYSVEKTNNYEETGIRHSDRYLNTIASDGSKCSGRVTHWAGIAHKGTYTEEGIAKSIL